MNPALEKPGSPNGEEPAEVLLAVVRTLVEELHPRAAAALGLDSKLDRELGLDSLALVELIGRLEETFELQLPEEALTDAETPRDLLRLLPSGSAGAPSLQPLERQTPTRPRPADASGPPEGAQTLQEVLYWQADRRPDQIHIRLLQASGSVEELTYGSLKQAAHQIAMGLREYGAEHGDRIALMLPTSLEYFQAFLGVLLAGGVPVPIYPPTRPSQLEDHLLRQGGILSNAEAHTLITVPEARTVARQLRLRVPSLRRVITTQDAADKGVSEEGGIPASEGDIALLQYTSGSTGAPKGVILTHANLLANLRAMGEAAGVETADDVFVSWLPLYHDMGLIGAWLGSLYYGMELVVMPPTSFLHRPAQWLRAIHQYRGTISASPNFGFELCLNRVTDDEVEGLDLSSWRIAFNGAEPVSPEAVLRFTERFGSCGFRAGTMTPVYGLAESSLGLTFPPLGRGPVIDRLAREPFQSSGRAVPAPESDTNPLRFVGCGTPLPGHEVRIVDEEARVQPERQQGRIEFRGPSATSGYFRNPEETGRLIRDGWVDSGDLGYLAGGELYVTGRLKDVVIRVGRNIHPQELEQAVGGIDGIRKGRAAVFGARDRTSGTEQMVVLAETRERDEEKRAQISQRILSASMDLLGTPPDDIVLAPPGTVLKTSSGKIRRAACRELYELGKLGEKPKPLWRQFLGLTWSATVLRLRRLPGTALSAVYAMYVWALFALVAPLVWLLVTVTPGLRLRWAVFRRAARLLLRLAAIPVAVEGRVNLPDRPCVVTANHASLLDGLVLAAVLPGPLVFVAAAELTNRSITATFLRRIGVEFVVRTDRAKAAAASESLQAAAGRGTALVFFPEGRMARTPGLQPFRIGAFAIAAEIGAPVVPVTIVGTGAILRGDVRVPRHGRIQVVIGDPISAPEPGWAGAIELRNDVRAFILRHLGEPDLQV
jgi:1-acyl-sn-glycerol-3-phosphate acyltransferase